MYKSGAVAVELVKIVLGFNNCVDVIVFMCMCAYVFYST